MTVDMDGPLCGCGGVGHLEALASGTGIANAARAALDAGAEAPALARIAARIAPQPLAAVHVSEAAADGDRRRSRHPGASPAGRGPGGGLHRQRLRPGRGHPGRRHHARLGRPTPGTGPRGRGGHGLPASRASACASCRPRSAMTSGLSARCLSSHRPCLRWSRSATISLRPQAQRGPPHRAGNPESPCATPADRPVHRPSCCPRKWSGRAPQQGDLP